MKVLKPQGYIYDELQQNKKILLTELSHGRTHIAKSNKSTIFAVIILS